MLAAARVLVTQSGLDGLSMRTLADRLGVSPNALYSHVDGKAGLVDDLLDEVLADVAVPDIAAVAPADGLVALMTSTYEVLLAHPDLVPAYVVRRGARGPNARHLGEVVLALLAAGGVTGPRAETALHVLIVHAIGFAAFATDRPLGTGDPPRPASPDDLGTAFADGLHWLLAGVLTPD